jgi:hypothetical protein
MSDGKVELDSAGDEPPNGKYSDWFDHRVAEQQLPSDSFVEQAIHSAAQLGSDFDAEEIILEANHAPFPIPGFGASLAVAGVREQVLAMINQWQPAQGKRLEPRQRPLILVNANHRDVASAVQDRLYRSIKLMERSYFRF